MEKKHMFWGKSCFCIQRKMPIYLPNFVFFRGKMGYIPIDHHEVKLSIPHVPTGKNDLHLQKSVWISILSSLMIFCRKWELNIMKIKFSKKLRFNDGEMNFCKLLWVTESFWESFYPNPVNGIFMKYQKPQKVGFHDK